MLPVNHTLIGFNNICSNNSRYIRRILTPPGPLRGGVRGVLVSAGGKTREYLGRGRGKAQGSPGAIDVYRYNHAMM